MRRLATQAIGPASCPRPFMDLRIVDLLAGNALATPGQVLQCAVDRTNPSTQAVYSMAGARHGNVKPPAKPVGPGFGFTTSLRNNSCSMLSAWLNWPNGRVHQSPPEEIRCTGNARPLVCNPRQPCCCGSQRRNVESRARGAGVSSKYLAKALADLGSLRMSRGADLRTGFPSRRKDAEHDVAGVICLHYGDAAEFPTPITPIFCSWAGQPPRRSPKTFVSQHGEILFKMNEMAREHVAGVTRQPAEDRKHYLESLIELIQDALHFRMVSIFCAFRTLTPLSASRPPESARRAAMAASRRNDGAR